MLFRSPEFHLYFGERISVYDFFVFQVMEEGFQGGDFPFDCFGLIFPVESGNVRFEYRRRDFMDACGWNFGSELRQIDAVCFQCLLVQPFLTSAVIQVIDYLCL